MAHFNPRQTRDSQGRWAPSGAANRGPTKQAVLDRYKAGLLRSRSSMGPLVRNPRQAYAIAHSVARSREKARRAKMANIYMTHAGPQRVLQLKKSQELSYKNLSLHRLVPPRRKGRA